ASRSPRMSVDEFATHISSSLPGGRSRVRPGRLIVSTSQLKPASVVSIAVIAVSLTICAKSDESFSYGDPPSDGASFARLAPAPHDHVHDIHQHGFVILVEGGGS